MLKIVKGGALWVLWNSSGCKIWKKLKGGPLGDMKISEKKLEDPLVQSKKFQKLHSDEKNPSEKHQSGHP